MKRARRPTKDTPTPRARRAREATCPRPWAVAEQEWGREYALGDVRVEALMSGAEVVLVNVAWRHPLGSVSLAEGVRLSLEIAKLMRWLEGSSTSGGGR